RFAFPDAAGAHDQTFRLIVKPDLWGHRLRLRFSNVYGDQPLPLDQVYVGVQSSGGDVVAETWWRRPIVVCLSIAVRRRRPLRLALAPSATRWSWTTSSEPTIRS